MKSISKYILFGALGFTAVACNDLDTAPQGNTITSDQKGDVISRDPAMIAASTNAIPTMFKQVGNVLGESVHLDFGYPAIMLALDSRTSDMVSDVIGYNWFSEEVEYSDINTTSRMTRVIWGTMYNQIFACNEVLSNVDKESEDPEVMYYMAQALGFRANAYFVLAQLYQYTYVGHQNDPCVPIITDENKDEVSINGAPRASVEDVYTLIRSDLDKAVALLEGSNNIAYTARADKAFLSAASAHGLRARVNLVQQRWSEAYADASYAIQKGRMTPYTMAEVGVPSFWDASDHSWLWGVTVDMSDRMVTSGIINWPSMACSFASNGYTAVGAWRKGSKALYESITASDVRKGWWLDENGVSNNLTARQQAYLDESIQAPSTPQYVNVKFDIYEGNFSNPSCANDIPLMRVEEMYLIAAEALGMGGDPAGASALLRQFVSTYRDQNYSFNTGSAQELQDEVWRQRRIELWGEGMAYYDIMRLNKGVDRRGAGFQPSYVYNIPAGDPIFLFQIPQTEVEGNKALGANNPTTTRPTPVADR